MKIEARTMMLVPLIRITIRAPIRRPASATSQCSLQLPIAWRSRHSSNYFQYSTI